MHLIKNIGRREKKVELKWGKVFLFFWDKRHHQILEIKIAQTMNITKHNKNGTMIWSKKLFLHRCYETTKQSFRIKKWKFLHAFHLSLDSTVLLVKQTQRRSGTSRSFVMLMSFNYLVSGMWFHEIWLIKSEKRFDMRTSLIRLIKSANIFFGKTEKFSKKNLYN